MDHSIEDGTAQATFDLLVRPTCLQLVADEVLIAIVSANERRWKLACWISTHLRCRMARSDLIPRQRDALQLPSLSVFAQRDDRIWDQRPRRGQDCLSYAPSPPSPHRLVDLGSTRGYRSDGTSTSGRPPHRWPHGPPHAVCAKSAVWSSRVDLIPLALTVDFQAGRIYLQHR